MTKLMLLTIGLTTLLGAGCVCFAPTFGMCGGSWAYIGCPPSEVARCMSPSESQQEQQVPEEGESSKKQKIYPSQAF